MGQNMNATVPFTDASLTLGSGPVDGVSITTTANEFLYAGAKTDVEAKGNMKLASGGLLAMGGKAGIVIGTPATICATAGGGVQIYAGAGLTAPTGSPGGPGAPFGPPKAAQVDAGKYADKMNSFNDSVKALVDIAGGVSGGGSATDKLGKAKGLFDIAKGSWDLAKAQGAESKGTDTTADIVGLGLDALALKSADSPAEAVTGAITIGAKMLGMGAGNDDKIKKLKAANAAAKGDNEAAAKAAGPGTPSDGPRIVEIAPANIDREVGCDMTSIVGGMKSTKVDGKIESTSGASHSMKAFNKIETSSMFFEAAATIAATMKGLATAKVESLGIVTIDGKARVKVESKGKIAIEAPTISVEGKTTWTLKTPKAKIDSPDVLIGTTKVKIDAKTEITELLKVLGDVINKKSVHIGKNLLVKGAGKVEGNLTVKKKIKNGSFSAS